MKKARFNYIHFGMRVLIGYLLSIIFLSCTQNTSNFLPISEDILIRKNNSNLIAPGNINPNHKWYVLSGNVKIDSSVNYGTCKSILLESQTKASTEPSEVYYLLVLEELEGDSITFTGKYKYKNATDATMQMGIRQINEIGESTQTIFTPDSIVNQKEWTSFQVKTAFNKYTTEIQFLVQAKRDIQLWISGCEVYLDNIPVLYKTDFGALKDHQFDKSSDIRLSATTPQTIENLEILGKIWGFLKYYHPEVTQGKYNWDYELFRVIHKIAQAKDTKERTKLLNKWVDKFGEIKETTDYAIKDSNLYSRVIDLEWIYDENLFDKSLISKLDRIKHAKRDSSFNYYVIPYMKTINNFFDREKPYPDISWEDQGYRILTLFRFWNAMEYCFPYLELTDKKWDQVLKEFLPLFLHPQDKTEYDLLLTRLVAQINDTHGNINIASQSFKQTVLERKYYRSSIPVNLRALRDGTIIIEDTRTYELNRGDIILSINNRDIHEIINELYPYTIASNQAVVMRDILPLLLKSNRTPIEVICLRNGKEIRLTLKNHSRNLKGKKTTEVCKKSWMDYDLESKNITYIDVGTMSIETMEDVIQKNWNAKGFIIDFRTYPNHFYMFKLFHQYFGNQIDTFSWVSKNQNSFPGNYKLVGEGIVGKQNPDYFKGKIALLVNEGTQSHGECCIMAFSKAPRNKVIGSTTAGADGNIGYFYLPGNIKVVYTALGYYYPNWEICQRVGIKIDLEVYPTLKDIQEGRDIWIEQGIKYILDDNQ